LAATGTAILIVIASKLGDPWKIVSFSVYSATLVLLYAFSTLYHSLRGRAKKELPLLNALGWSGFAWLLAGGVFYTGGILFYVYDEQWRHAHGIWHLFVLAGSASHFGAILMFVA